MNMPTAGSNRTYELCPKKEKAREETIINTYREHFSHSLPQGKQYWTMCSGHTHDDGTFSEGSELGQLLKAGLITPEQFYGVDIVEDIIAKNKTARPDANWLSGDFYGMMCKTHKNDVFNPAIINADFITMNKKSSKMTASIIDLLSFIDCRNVMVVSNVMYTNPYARKRISSDVEVDGDSLLKEYGEYPEFQAGFASGWNIHPKCYSYGGTGEKSNTIMATLIFYRF